MLATERDNIGAVAMAKSALSFICAFNDLPTIRYSSLRTNAALESMKRKHKHQTRKTENVTVDMVRTIMDAYGFVRTERPAREQWELALGAAIAIAFKLLLRYSDIRRCR
jgi:hypothetical protein